MSDTKINDKKNLASAVSFFLISIFVLPILAHGAGDGSGLIQCGNSTTTDANGNVSLLHPCTFTDLISTINLIINWFISIAGVIFTISAIYGGFLYMTSGVKPGNKDKAKDILWSTLIGFVIILVAWLIVYTILNVLVIQGQKTSVMRFIGQ